MDVIKIFFIFYAYSAVRLGIFVAKEVKEKKKNM